MASNDLEQLHLSPRYSSRYFEFHISPKHFLQSFNFTELPRHVTLESEVRAFLKLTVLSFALDHEAMKSDNIQRSLTSSPLRRRCSKMTSSANMTDFANMAIIHAREPCCSEL
jgi:hypothetical protein